MQAGLAFDQRPLAFQAPRGRAGEARVRSFVRIEGPAALMAFKRAEQGDEVILRLRETHGEPAESVVVQVGAGIASAREVDGGEQPLEDVGDLRLEDGRLLLDLAPFQPRTIALTLSPPDASLDVPASRPLTLPLDVDMVSVNEARDDGAFDPAYHRALSKPSDATTSAAFPAEQWPETLIHRGI